MPKREEYYNADRHDHRFQFKASEISEAARAEAEYHEDRLKHWQESYDIAVKRVEETVGAKVDKVPVTGGTQVCVVIDYGDPAAHSLMQTSWGKIHRHREQAEQYRVDERVYASQGDRVYDLSVSDVSYFRLGDEPRPDDSVDDDDDVEF
jgi:hypothetical protein